MRLPPITPKEEMLALTAHSKHVIIAAIVGVVLLYGTIKIVSHMDGVAHDQAVLAKAKLENDLQIAKTQATQSQIDTKTKQQADLATTTALNSLAASNQSLKLEVSSLKDQLAKLHDQDAAANPQQLSTRWLELIAGVGSVQPSADGVSVSLPAAHATVDALEQVPVLNQQLKDTNDNSAKKDDTIQKQQDSITADVKLLTDKQAELNTCKTSLSDSEKACKKEISDAVNTARKHGVWAAVGAFIGGIIFGHKF